MKRIGYLYDKVWDMDNIREAHKNARKRKAHYREVQMVDADPERYFLEIQRLLRDKQYRTSEYKVFIKLDKGKEREIYKLPYFPDRIVHHCIMQVVEPLWMKTFIRDTYASMKYRGIHDGVKRIKAKLQKYPEETQYALQVDVRKFYPSINHDTLKSTLRRKIKDPDLLWLMDEIIDSNPKGVPIGNYLSQYFGNLYLSDIDHWLKEETQCKHYFRYCDDLVILHPVKDHLHAIRVALSHKLAAIQLTLKDNWRVYPVNTGVDFLGYKFFHTHTLLRTSLAKRFRERAAYIRRNWYRMPVVSAMSTLMSYYGWQKYANAWNLYTKHLSYDLRQRMNWRLFGANNPLKGIMT